MVLENILSPTHVREKPTSAFMLGIFYAAVAVVLAYFIFPDDPSISIIFLTTLAALPLLINVLTVEEEEEMETLKIAKKMPLIRSHMDVFLVFTYMFFGFLVLFIFTYIFLPSETVNLLFSKQIKTITSILGPSNFSGSAIQGAFTAEESLKIILLNNFKVLLFSLLFSFLYGAGAIFILAWNSSILAVAMGNFIKRQIGTLGGGVSAYFKASSLGVARYMIHGLPEIGAYFLGAIAGGIISAAVVKSDYKDPKFYEIVLDSFDLIALAVLLLIIGALLEVSVTPLLFS
ncbi:MAG: hypothetical protein J7K73_03480 [Nanoarchaeota archaeon]|nr:hypothetical protein [Nanoarchaeota archaeon]